MTIEQQVRDAVADFHDLIAEGHEIASAIAIASAANSLKNGVLEHCLSRTMPIEAIVQEIMREVVRKEKFEVIYDAVLQHASETRGEWFKPAAQKREERLSYARNALGRPLSNEEEAQVDAAHKKFTDEVNGRFQRDFVRGLREAQARTPNAED